MAFWSDRWCSASPLSEGCPDNFNLDWRLKVADVLKDSMWDLDSLYSLLPRELAYSVFSVSISPGHGVEDKVVWAANNKGSFSVKSAYSWLI